MRRVVALLHRRAELQQDLVHLRAQLHDAMRVALDHVDVAVPVDRAGVLPVRIELLAVQLLVAAGRHQLAVGVEHHHRLGAAIEHVDAIVLIDRQARNARLVGRPLPGGTRRVAPVPSRGAPRPALRAPPAAEAASSSRKIRRTAASASSARACSRRRSARTPAPARTTSRSVAASASASVEKRIRRRIYFSARENTPHEAIG